MTQLQHPTNRISTQLIREKNKFLDLSAGSRRLVLANFCFILVSTLVSYSASAFLFRSTHDVLFNLNYFSGYFIGLSLGFLTGGLFLHFVRLNYLYIAAMLIHAFSFLPLLFLKSITPAEVIVSGCLVGLGTGMYWGMRHYITILSTTDENRNYFGGVEYSLMTVAQLVAPVLFSILTRDNGSNYLMGYIAVFVITTLLFLVAAFSIARGRYESIPLKRFIYLRYDKLWNIQRAINIFEGVAEGVFFFLPPILIFHFFGNESALGTVEFFAVLITTIPVYLLGRLTLPRHRIGMLTLSICAFFAGSLLLALSFTIPGLMIFYVCYKLANVLNPFSYTTIRMRTIDRCSRLTRRDRFSFIFDSDVFMEIGRLSGLLIFYLLFRNAGEESAMRYALLIVAILQFGSLWFCRKLTHQVNLKS